jgi:hypothetical protein
MPHVEVVVPFRSLRADRVRNQWWTEIWWRQHFPRFGYCSMSDGGIGPFNKSRAMNRALAGTDAVVVVIADADMVPESASAITEAVNVAESGGWAVPTQVAWLGTWATARQLALGSPQHPLPLSACGPSIDLDGECEMPDAEAGYALSSFRVPDPLHGDEFCLAGGIVVVSKRAFAAAGGADERFECWGGEDHALGLALEAVAGPAAELGRVLHLEHETTAPSVDEVVRNRGLAVEYLQHRGDIAAMLGARSRT